MTMKNHIIKGLSTDLNNVISKLLNKGYTMDEINSYKLGELLDLHDEIRKE